MNQKSLDSPLREDNIRQIVLNVLIKEQKKKNCCKNLEEGEHSSSWENLESFLKQVASAFSLKTWVWLQLAET